MHYYSKLFTGVLTPRSLLSRLHERVTDDVEARRVATENRVRVHEARDLGSACARGRENRAKLAKISFKI